MKFFKAVFLAGAMVLPAQAVLAQSQTLHFAHNVQATHPRAIAADIFAEEVARASDNDIRVVVYPAGQMASLREGAEGVQLGTVDLTWADAGTLGNWTPELSFSSLPFLFEDMPTANARMDAIMDDLTVFMRERLNTENLGWSPEGFRVIVTAPRGVPRASDMEGLKMRVPEVPLYVSVFGALRTNATPLPWGDIYSAIQTGVIDGAEGASTAIVSSRLHEVANYVARTNHILTDAFLMMNLDRFNSLSEDQQEAIRTAAAISIERLRELAADEEDVAFAALAESLEVAEDLDIESYRAAMAPVYEEFIAENGEQAQVWLDAVRD